MSYSHKYPGITDLKRRAQQRIPSFAFDYVDGGIDEESGKKRNRDAFHDIHLTPRYLVDVTDADLSVNLFGKEYAMPFGVPPIGLGNMMWPGAELALAASAQKHRVPYILSTFSTTDMNRITEAAPDVAWFQLYVPRKQAVMVDLLRRVKEAGFHALVVTLDIPVGAKRNRELKNGLKLPFSFTPWIVWQAVTHPVWAIATLKYGQPDFVNVLKYRDKESGGLAEFITNFNMKGVTAERIAEIRKLWDGPLILKGVQYPSDAQTAIDLGLDGIIVSNHGGRQLDAAPASIESLQKLSDSVHHKLTVMVDSGIRTGLDVVRAKALGAQAAFSGRSFFWGMGALGLQGADQVMGIYQDEITRALQQLGCGAFRDMDSSWLSANDQ
ncbi:MAG: alpha-hydroxy acid oxidase [Pseudomonadota bacterium]